jgi:hypothetical protein
MRSILGAGVAGIVVIVLLSAAPSAAQRPKRVSPGASSNYAQAVLACHPIAYWRLGEAQGATKAADSTNSGHDGTYQNNVQLGQPGAIAGDSDTAVGLDGPQSKSYVEIPDADVFSVAASGQGLSVEVWMRPDTLSFQGENPDPSNAYIHWLGKGQKGAFEWGMRFYNQQAQRSNRISAYIWNADGKEGAGAYVEEPLQAQQWVYIVATFDDPGATNPRVQIYKNGVPSKHNASPGTLYASFGIVPKGGSAPVRLGTRDRHGFLTGGLDEVAIYPRVLSAAEIKAHWLSATQ